MAVRLIKDKPGLDNFVQKDEMLLVVPSSGQPIKIHDGSSIGYAVLSLSGLDDLIKFQKNMIDLEVTDI